MIGGNVVKELTVGQVVSSKSGRDRDRAYVVVGVLDDTHVLLADGSYRKVSQPKTKNIKHLVVHKTGLAQVITNDQVRRTLQRFHRTTQDHGGEEDVSDGER